MAPARRTLRPEPAPTSTNLGDWKVVAQPDIPVPRIRRRRSRLHGWGVFALEDIPKNRRIVAYTGQRIPANVSLERERFYLEHGSIWCFALNRRWVIDGHVGGSLARYVNHSCEPNCYAHIIDGIIWIRAARNVKAGEELTYNYYTDGEGRIQCRCRPGCRTMI